MTVKILYLYPDFMNLYGDNGNVRILERRLKDQGFDVKIVNATITDEHISFDDVDFVYMGSGYESNRDLVSKHIRKFKAEFISAVENGVPMLFTGNGYDILGKGITTSYGVFKNCLGLFNFTFKEQIKTRYTGDLILEDPETNEKYVGFVNRAGVPEDQEEMAFGIVKVIGEYPVKKDGVRVNNLLGISLIGPVLLKNPVLADRFVEIICRRKGIEPKKISYPNSVKSHEKTLKALTEAEV